MTDFITDDWMYNSIDSFLSKLGDSIDDIQDRLEQEAEGIADQGEFENYVMMAANLHAVGFLVDNYMDLVQFEVLRACANSVEYNYDLYVNHLLSALFQHRDDIVRIHFTGSYSTPEIIVDFSSLGGIEEWASAVEEARKDLGVGRLRDRDIAIASEKWKRYIYQVDREGKSVERKKKKKDGSIEIEDVTEKYRGKYRDTIMTRLSKLSSDRAPFWYLIEHGNTTGASGDSVMEGGGTAYPIVIPQKMQDGVENQLRIGFTDTFNKYREIAERVIRGRGRGGGPINEPPEEPIDWVPKTIQQIVDEAIAQLPPYDPSMTTKKQAVVKDTEGTFYEIYYKRGGIVDIRMADAAHRYIGKPWWWE